MSEQKVTEKESLDGLAKMLGVEDPMMDLEAEVPREPQPQQEESADDKPTTEEPKGEAVEVEETLAAEVDKPTEPTEPAEDEPAGEVELEEAPSAFDQQLEEIRRENARLREQVDAMFLKGSGDSVISSGISGVTQAKPSEAQPAQPTQPAQPMPPAGGQIQTRDIRPAITSDLHAKVMESPAAFADLMQAVYEQAMLDGRESYMREFPQMVNPVVDGRLEVQQQVMHLFLRHPKLSAHRDEVGMMARVIEARHPGKNIGEVFSLLETDLTSNHSDWLNLPDNDNATGVKTAPVALKRVVKPAIPGGPRKRAPGKTKVKLNEFEQDMVDLAKSGHYPDDN